MPKIFEKDGFVIYVYPLEMNERHHLAHIHIYRGRFGGASMVLQIPDLEVLANTMNAADSRKAKILVTSHLSEILEKLEALW
jgi:hypothetical protein